MKAPSIVMKRYWRDNALRLIPSVITSQSIIETENAESEMRMNADLYSALAFWEIADNF